jgi:prevent-host-death family protein
MKYVSINELKQGLASVIAEVQSGTEVLITRHSKPVARLSGPEVQYLRRGLQFGKASLKPAVRRKTADRYLQFLEEDRRGGGE